MKYIVSYIAKSSTGIQSGWVVVTINHLISSKESLLALTDKISKEKQLSDVVIVNWRRMEDPE